MHQLNVLIYGPASFISTLNELKAFLKFNHFTENSKNSCDIVLFHSDVLKDNKTKEIIYKSSSLKVFTSNKRDQKVNCDGFLILPTTIKEINSTIENIAARKKFSINSSIQVKTYLMDKNEKKLIRQNKSVVLTEKEVQLIELFLDNSKPLSKDKILSTVWNYSSETDTHTVETHIYRLRKKINDKFKDNQFIKNNKKGYHL